MCAFHILSSSRKSHKLRLLPRGQRACRKGYWRSKMMQHNMGLCCMNGDRGGGRVGYFFFWAGAQGKRLGKSEQLYRKGS